MVDRNLCYSSWKICVCVKRKSNLLKLIFRCSNERKMVRKFLLRFKCVKCYGLSLATAFFFCVLDNNTDNLFNHETRAWSLLSCVYRCWKFTSLNETKYLFEIEMTSHRKTIHSVHKFKATNSCRMLIFCCYNVFVIHIVAFQSCDGWSFLGVWGQE